MSGVFIFKTGNTVELV